MVVVRERKRASHLWNDHVTATRGYEKYLFKNHFLAMTPRLPLEVVERIIDDVVEYNHNYDGNISSIKCFKACALVCHSFLPLRRKQWCIQLCWYCVSLYRCSVIILDHVGYFGGPFAVPFLTFIEGFAGESTRMNAQQFNKEFEAVGQLQEHHLKIRFMPVKHWKSSHKFLSVFFVLFNVMFKFARHSQNYCTKLKELDLRGSQAVHKFRFANTSTRETCRATSFGLCVTR